MPADLSSWNLVFHNRTRVWDRATLDLSISHKGDLRHTRAFFDKLRSGKPIVAVAVGSSFFALAAGCVTIPHDAPINVPNPGIYEAGVGAEGFRCRFKESGM